MAHRNSGMSLRAQSCRRSVHWTGNFVPQQAIKWYPCISLDHKLTRSKGSVDVSGERRVLAMSTPSELRGTAPTQSRFPPYLPEMNGDYEAKMQFTRYANWLIPGALMVGRYPFVEPSRCNNREEGEAMLEYLITAGITTFYSLQGELPSQEEMPMKGVNGFQPYKATATLIAAALSDPPSLDETNGLRTPYLDKYLPPRKKQVEKPRRRIELSFAHTPITDLGVPTEEQYVVW